MKSVLAFGNPLLDITITSSEMVKEILVEYNLKIDGQKEIDKDEMDQLIRDIEGLPQHRSPGGCSQNTLRVMQWILKQKADASMFGSVGNDADAEILKKRLASEGVKTRYIKQDNLPTGKTVSLVSGTRRSLVAHIGAAEHFPLNSLLSFENFQSIVESADIVLIEAYFLTGRFNTAKHVVDICRQKNKLLIYTLCGDYLFKLIPQEIKYLVLNSSMIFGNREEFLELCKLLQCASIPYLAQTFPDKMLVITDGPNPVMCSKDGNIEVVPAELRDIDIVDTNAAGDGFLGGFLAGLVLEKDNDKCLAMGFYAAENIIRQQGCTLPSFESSYL